jgi:hypothetical protein
VPLARAEKKKTMKNVRLDWEEAEAEDVIEQ